MVLAEISIKLIFLPKRKESCVPLLVVQIHFYGPNGLPTSFHFFKFMHGGMYFC